MSLEVWNAFAVVPNVWFVVCVEEYVFWINVLWNELVTLIVKMSVWTSDFWILKENFGDVYLCSLEKRTFLTRVSTFVQVISRQNVFWTSKFTFVLLTSSGFHWKLHVVKSSLKSNVQKVHFWSDSQTWVLRGLMERTCVWTLQKRSLSVWT